MDQLRWELVCDNNQPADFNEKIPMFCFKEIVATIFVYFCWGERNSIWNIVNDEKALVTFQIWNICDHELVWSVCGKNLGQNESTLLDTIQKHQHVMTA